MATGPKVVHKQFNSPIGLYSQQNIQETLSKHMQNLDNGTVGIDFNNPTTDKPVNLANSAVLRMLEEEERNRRAYPNLDRTQIAAIQAIKVRASRRFDSSWPPKKDETRMVKKWNCMLNPNCQVYPEFTRATEEQKKVVWPPVPETNGYHQPQQQSPQYYNNAQHSPSLPQTEVPPQYQPQEPQYRPQEPQYRPKENQFRPQVQPTYDALPQGFCEGLKQEACGLSKLIPVGPGVTAAPVASAPQPLYRQAPPSPAQPNIQSPRWAPVQAPLSPQAYGSQAGYPSQVSPQPQYSPEPYLEPAYLPPQKTYEPPPSTIQLRQQPPVHQKPPPVFPSQPATASFQGGVNMRGDQKWPPQEVREAVAAENEARRQLAKGPACRPRKLRQYTLAELLAMNEA